MDLNVDSFVQQSCRFDSSAVLAGAYVFRQMVPCKVVLNHFCPPFLIPAPAGNLSVSSGVLTTSHLTVECFYAGDSGICEFRKSYFVGGSYLVGVMNQF